MSEVDLQRTRAITDMAISGSTISRSAVKAFIATERSQADDTIATLTARLAEQEQRLDGYSAMCAEQEARADSLATRLAEVEGERDALATANNDLFRRAADLNTRIARLTPERDSLRAEVEHEREASKELRAETLRDASIILRDTRRENAGLRREAARLRGALEEARAWVESARDCLRTMDYDAAQGELLSMEEQLTAALSPAPEVTHECDQCGEKTGADWTSWQCPGGSGGFGSCDGKMVPLSPAPEGERSIDECPACGEWMGVFGGEVFDGTTETCEGCGATVEAHVRDGRAFTTVNPTPEKARETP